MLINQKYNSTYFSGQISTKIPQKYQHQIKQVLEEQGVGFENPEIILDRLNKLKLSRKMLCYFDLTGNVFQKSCQKTVLTARKLFNNLLLGKFSKKETVVVDFIKAKSPEELDKYLKINQTKLFSKANVKNIFSRQVDSENENIGFVAYVKSTKK